MSVFRHAICNEVYQGVPFEDACRSIAGIGYTGLEIAPFTLAEEPSTIPPARRRELRDAMADAGLAFVGLHWLMVSPKGLHVTAPDPAVRERGWLHIRHLIDLCADLGPDGVMVFGSPQQRRTVDGMTPQEATRRYTDGLASVTSHAEERGVTILVEALPSSQCDVICTVDEAAAVVHAVSSPAVRTMFDTHNAADETEPHEAVLDRHFGLVRHVHVNEMDGRHPGTGDYDFKPVLRVLRRCGYLGWVSLEAFDFTPGPERIATESLRHLRRECSLVEAEPIV